MKTTHYILTAGMLPLLLSACGDTDYEYESDKYHPTLDDYFDFNTSESLQLTINYGSLNAYAEVVLFEGPVSFLEGGLPAAGEEAIFSGQLNANGSLSISLKCPADETGLMTLYCDGLAAPATQIMRIEGGALTFVNPNTSEAAQTRNLTRAAQAAEYEIYPIDTERGFYSIMYWESKDDNFFKYGFAEDNNGITSISKHPRHWLNYQNAFYSGQGNRGAHYEGQYVLNYEGTTTPSGSEVVNLKLTKSTGVDLVFCRERSSYLDVLGYYYYPTGETPDSPEGLKKYIVAPVIATPDMVPYDGKAAADLCRGLSYDSPTEQAQTFELLYEDAEGHVSKTFPAGLTIGFFLITDGFELPFNPSADEMTSKEFATSKWAKSTTDAQGNITYPVMEGASTINTRGGVKRLLSAKSSSITQLNQNPRYSNHEWNVDATNNKKGEALWACLDAQDGQVVYAVEDHTDKSYDDMIFVISPTVAGAINTDGLPKAQNLTLAQPTARKTDWSNGLVVYTNNSSALPDRYYTARPVTWAFEDVWPNKGDYDMNDVIVEHRQMIEFDTDGMAWHVYDYYEVVQPAGSAKNVNAFGIQMSEEDYNRVEVVKSGPVDNYVEDNRALYDEYAKSGSFILFSDCNNAKNLIVGMTRSYSGKKSREAILNEDLNPFIIANYEGLGKGNRKEVHLPKHSPTALADKSLINKGNDAFYIDTNGNYPFAFEIPMAFDPVPESTCISNYYTDFDGWVHSKGTRYSSWYRTHK